MELVGLRALLGMLSLAVVQDEGVRFEEKEDTFGGFCLPEGLSDGLLGSADPH